MAYKAYYGTLNFLFMITFDNYSFVKKVAYT